MRHKVNNHGFGRKQGPRKSLIRGLVTSLVEHGRITTTLPKAKELRKYVEKAITKGKKGSVHARRTLFADYPNKDTVKTIVDDLSVRFKDRPGGYTRVIKTGPRPGDNADMAVIEFVDYELPVKTEESAPIDFKEQSRLAKKFSDKRKTLRTIQKKSRRINRPRK